MSKRITFEDLEVRQFGYLTLLSNETVGINKVQVKCICGKEKLVLWNNLKRGMTKSCGCKRAVNKHEHSDEPIYRVWRSMVGRCCYPTDLNYHYYGGRGIKVYQPWRDSFEKFYADNIDEYAQGLELDRFPDRNGNYEPGNVRWVTHLDNMRNTRRCKLSLEIAREIRASKESAVVLAEKYNIVPNAIWQVRRNETWKE